MDSPLVVTPHRTLNSCQEVISESDLLCASETEILEGLSDQGVTQCQRFGHSQTSCRGQLTCSRCASVGHASTDCSLERKCINCLQPHPSDSKICLKWKIEKQIQEIKTTQNISYPEARKLIVSQLSQTYAHAAKSYALNNSTQTDENITKIKCPPFKITCTTIIQTKTKYSYCCYHIILSLNATLAFHLFKNIYNIGSSATNSPMSETKGKINEQPSQLHRLRKDSKKIDLLSIKPTTNLKKNPAKNTSLKIAREQDSPNETSPVSKKSRRRKTFKTSDAMDTDANPSDSDYVTGLASEEDESLLEADFKKVADGPFRKVHPKNIFPGFLELSWL
ncbi:putative RNA-directed DNA polymerase from transposon X-element [Trichonephila clavipes]|nr:putative RNA-directed DNA polymerase from transposon X-element [Trichonephila clavipes]